VRPSSVTSRAKGVTRVSGWARGWRVPAYTRFAPRLSAAVALPGRNSRPPEPALQSTTVPAPPVQVVKRPTKTGDTIGATTGHRWTPAVTSAAPFTVALGTLVVSALISSRKDQS
jgi:hypothetical protein